MYYFITLDQIKTFFTSIGIDVFIMSGFEEAILFILCNIFVLLTIIFILSFLYKVFVRLWNWMF